MSVILQLTVTVSVSNYYADNPQAAGRELAEFIEIALDDRNDIDTDADTFSVELTEVFQ